MIQGVIVAKSKNGKQVQQLFMDLNHFLQKRHNGDDGQRVFDRIRLRAFTAVLVSALTGIYPDRIKFDRTAKGVRHIVIDLWPEGTTLNVEVLLLGLWEEPDGLLLMSVEIYRSVDAAVEAAKFSIQRLIHVRGYRPEYQKATLESFARSRASREVHKKPGTADPVASATR